MEAAFAPLPMIADVWFVLVVRETGMWSCGDVWWWWVWSMFIIGREDRGDREVLCGAC